MAPGQREVLCKPDGRVDVSEPASISSGIAKRYATAIFELARETKSLKSLETDVTALDGALNISEDLRGLIASPVYTRDQVSRAITALACHHTKRAGDSLRQRHFLRDSSDRTGDLIARIDRRGDQPAQISAFCQSPVKGCDITFKRFE